MTITPNGRVSFELGKKEMDILCDAWRIVDNLKDFMESRDFDNLVYGYEDSEEYCSIDKIKECSDTLDCVKNAWAME